MTRRKMGEAIGRVSDEAKFEMLETIKNVIDMSRVSDDAWRDLLLVYAVNEAHDQGVDKADFERAVAGIIEEEWSTPNTTGRANRRRN